VAFLIVLGLLLLIGFVAMMRSSRHFKGMREHYASEERPDIRTSKAWSPNDIGGGPP
jgi:hypothetical protein